ncbi:MAG TPA: serine/threonine-protein kinase [Polyangiaceae bacterium]|nr:serine/threonine-protein kinase [Polyangiaceae bacterium]
MTQPIPLSELALAPESRTKPISGRGLRLLCRLGQGGMAEVHLANAAPFGAPPSLVVVKRMHQQHVDDPATVRMFLDEARLALCLSHPNIVRSERLGMFDGRHGIVMEFLEGQPFHQVLKRAYEVESSFSLELLVQIAIAALDGLHYAHELKDVVGNHLALVHRDVSPQNLFLTYDGAVKLLDFGIAKNAMQDGRTRTGLLKGKIAYMAPEQARGEEIDRRADIWSLGVVLWEAVTGSRLFKGINEAATLNLTLSEEVSSPSLLRPDLPHALELILMRALERDASERYSTAAEMRDDLEGWLSTRELLPGASVSTLMQRLFSKEMREQRQQITGLLNAQPDLSSESGVTLVAPLLGTNPSLTGFAGTQVSSVTDLMDELTRQRRATTRLLSGLLLLVACALAFGVYWTLVLRPPQTQAATSASNGSTTLRPVAAALTPAADTATAPALRESATASRAAPSDARSASKAGAAPRPATARAGKPRDAGEPALAPLAPTLAPVTASSAVAETGLLNLDTMPWSTVSVGGRVLGTTPIVGASLPAGSHTLVLSNPELGLKTTYQVNISAGRTTARRVGLE